MSLLSAILLVVSLAQADTWSSKQRAKFEDTGRKNLVLSLNYMNSFIGWLVREGDLTAVEKTTAQKIISVKYKMASELEHHWAIYNTDHRNASKPKETSILVFSNKSSLFQLQPGEPERTAVTGSDTTTFVYFNEKYLVDYSKVIPEPFPIGDGIRLLIHEFGHKIPNKDQVVVDTVAAKVQAFYEKKTIQVHSHFEQYKHLKLTVIPSPGFVSRDWAQDHVLSDPGAAFLFTDGRSLWDLSSSIQRFNSYGRSFQDLGKRLLGTENSQFQLRILETGPRPAIQIAFSLDRGAWHSTYQPDATINIRLVKEGLYFFGNPEIEPFLQQSSAVVPIEFNAFLENLQYTNNMITGDLYMSAEAAQPLKDEESCRLNFESPNHPYGTNFLSPSFSEGYCRLIPITDGRLRLEYVFAKDLVTNLDVSGLTFRGIQGERYVWRSVPSKYRFSVKPNAENTNPLQILENHLIYHSCTSDNRGTHFGKDKKISFDSDRALSVGDCRYSINLKVKSTSPLIKLSWLRSIYMAGEKAINGFKGLKLSLPDSEALALLYPEEDFLPWENMGHRNVKEISPGIYQVRVFPTFGGRMPVSSPSLFQFQGLLVTNERLETAYVDLVELKGPRFFSHCRDTYKGECESKYGKDPLGLGEQGN